MESVILTDYYRVLDSVKAAVQSALAGPIREGLEAEVAKYALQNVYSYDAAPYFKAKRRFSLSQVQANYDVSISDMSLTIDGSGIALQYGVGGEVDIVEQGAGWHQPGPRPYMDEALQNYIASGQADQALASALSGSGFTATAG